MLTDLEKFCRGCKNKACKEICSLLQRNIPNILRDTEFRERESIPFEEWERKEDFKTRAVALEEVSEANYRQYELVIEIVDGVVKNKQSALHFKSFIQSEMSMAQIARMSGVSKQAIHKSFQRIIKRISKEMEKKEIKKTGSEKPSTPLKFKRIYKP